MAEVILAEEFTDNRRGWPETHNQGGPATGLRVAITDGAYVCVNPTSTYWLGWTAVDVNQARDFQIEVSMRQTAGTASTYGVVWGLHDADNFYEFSVSGGNRFSYAERAENEYRLLLSGQTEPVPMPALTTLAVRKRGPGIDFLVNGRSVGGAGFGDFFGDKVGFVVNGGMTVEIDRLVVSQPPAEDAVPPLPPPAPASAGAPVPAPLAPPAPPPAPSPRLIFEPLALSISKFRRDAFGQRTQPFLDSFSSMLDGTQLEVKVTPAVALNARIVTPACALRVFRDDRGLDLLAAPDGHEAEAFLQGRGPLSVRPSGNQEAIGLTFRSHLVPSANAARVIVEGILVFALLEREARADHGALALSAGEIVKVGPVQIRFFQSPDRSPKLKAEPGKDSPDQPAPPVTPNALWYAQVLGGPAAVDASALLFGSDEDVPLLNTQQRGGYTFTDGRPAVEGAGRDAFDGICGYGFRCPDGRISRIKVRYTPPDGVLQVPFRVETDLGLTNLASP
jgi:hypothetical protein